MEVSTDLHGASTDLHGDLHGPPWSSMELRGGLHGVPDNVGRRPQGESPVRLAKEPVSEASGVSQLRKKH